MNEEQFLDNPENTPASDKPTGAKEGWLLQQTERPVENKVLKWREDHVRVEGSGNLDYSYIEKSPGILIVPITTDGQMVLIRQYRYPVDQWCLEIPAGSTFDTGDLSFEDVARKELEEEVGGTCASLEFIASFYAEPSLTDEQCHVYLALGVELNLLPHPEGSEAIERLVVPVGEALKMAREGELKSGPCTLAIFLCQNALARLGHSVG